MVRKRTRHDDHRGGVDLVIRYDRAEQAFVGTVHDTTAEPIADVRVEVHLSSGVELGPTPRRDLAPGATGTVRLDAPGQMFDRWSVHVEIGQSEVPVLPTLALPALAALLVAGGARRLTTAATIAVLMFAVGCGDSPTEPSGPEHGPEGGGLDAAPTVAGLEEVRRAVKSARRLFLVTDPVRSPPSGSRSGARRASSPTFCRAPVRSW